MWVNIYVLFHPVFCFDILHSSRCISDLTGWGGRGGSVSSFIGLWYDFSQAYRQPSDRTCAVVSSEAHSPQLSPPFRRKGELWAAVGLARCTTSASCVVLLFTKTGLLGVCALLLPPSCVWHHGYFCLFLTSTGATLLCNYLAWCLWVSMRVCLPVFSCSLCWRSPGVHPRPFSLLPDGSTAHRYKFYRWPFCRHCPAAAMPSSALIVVLLMCNWEALIVAMFTCSWDTRPAVDGAVEGGGGNGMVK